MNYQCVKDALYDSYNTYLKKSTDTGTGQNVGMLTKIDPLKDLVRTDYNTHKLEYR